VLVENMKVQLVRPPVTILKPRVQDRTLSRALGIGLCVHVSLRSCSLTREYQLEKLAYERAAVAPALARTTPPGMGS